MPPPPAMRPTLAVDQASPSTAASSATAAVMASNIAQQRDQLNLLQERIKEKADEVTPCNPPVPHRALDPERDQCCTLPRRCLRLRVLKRAPLTCACVLHAGCTRQALT